MSYEHATHTIFDQLGISSGLIVSDSYQSLFDLLPDLTGKILSDSITLQQAPQTKRLE